MRAACLSGAVPEIREQFARISPNCGRGPTHPCGAHAAGRCDGGRGSRQSRPAAGGGRGSRSGAPPTRMTRCALISEDLRIVTVIAEDPLEVRSQRKLSVPHYRLAHDFLVTPISVWLDRVRRRTWRGRSKARLSELSNAWSRRPVRRISPGFFEYLSLFVGSVSGLDTIRSRYVRTATRSCWSNLCCRGWGHCLPGHDRYRHSSAKCRDG